MRLTPSSLRPIRGWGAASVLALLAVVSVGWSTWGMRAGSTLVPLAEAELALFFEEVPVLADAERVLLDDCLRRRVGESSSLSLDQTSATENRQLTFSGLPNPLVAHEAAIVGYGPRLGADASERPHELAAYIDHLDPEDAVRVEARIPGTGHIVSAPGEGCYAEARTQLYGSVDNWLRLDQTAMIGVRQHASEAVRDPAVVDAAATYALCMQQAGYESSNPGETWEAAEERFGHGGPDRDVTNEERRQAVTDARCQSSTEVYEAVEAATLRGAAGWIKAHTDELRRLLGVRQDALVAAEAVLNGSR